MHSSSNHAALDPMLEVYDIARTLREIEWLLVVLVLLMYVLRAPSAEASFAVAMGLCVYAAAITVASYAIPSEYHGRWLIALETWLMIGFITWILYYTGAPGKLVGMLYILPIIVTGLVLGRGVTMLQVALIGACYLFVGQAVDPSFFSSAAIGDFAIDMGPMLLVAYTTNMLSGDIVTSMSRMKATSDADELTGLYNIRGFNELAKHELAQAARHHRIFSLMMIDSDNLKNVNDTYGHQVGDKLIRTIAEVMRSSTKSSDILARYGGDEFVCLLPSASGGPASRVGERIRHRLADEPLMIRNSPVAMTVSIGIATYPAHGDDLEMLLKNADRALYVSKARGRDCVTLYEARTNEAAPCERAA